MEIDDAPRLHAHHSYGKERRRARLDRLAPKYLMTDDELIAFVDRKRIERVHEARMQEATRTLESLQLQARPACSSCQDGNTLLTSSYGCQQHLLCSECADVASKAEVKTCPFCPPPPVGMDVRCHSCNHVSSLQASESFICCNQLQESRLLRHFHRDGRLTNFLTAEELLRMRHQFKSSNFAVTCMCGMAVERQSACNELYHCGHHRLCACCGAFTLPWEDTLQQHCAESGCRRHVDDDQLVAVVGEQEAVRMRIQAMLVQVEGRVG